MRLSEIDLMRLIPVFMQDDETTKAFIAALNAKLRKAASSIEIIRIYENLDMQSEDILDELAWQFNVTEYRHTYDIATKRKLLKKCLAIHHKRGTVASVKEVVTNIFGSAIVEEWFEYGGEPYHFRVRTSNASSSDEMIEELTAVVKATQNVRSHLESVRVEIDNSMELYTGAVVTIIDDERLEVDTSDIEFADTASKLAVCGSDTAICGEVYCGT